MALPGVGLHWSTPDRLPRQVVRVAPSGVAPRAKAEALLPLTGGRAARPPALIDAVLEHLHRPYETFVVGQ